jgi:hypothetical protein
VAGRTGLPRLPARLDLYDLDEGRETNDVSSLHLVLVVQLALQLEAEVVWRPRTLPPLQAVLPATVVDRFCALGYVR